MATVQQLRPTSLEPNNIHDMRRSAPEYGTLANIVPQSSCRGMRDTLASATQQGL
jgi:hypothetical protein